MGLLGELFSIGVEATSELVDIIKDSFFDYSDYSDHSDYSDAAVRRQKEREIKEIALAEEQKALQNSMNRMMKGEMSSFLQGTPYENLSAEKLTTDEFMRMKSTVSKKIKTDEANEIRRSTESIQKEIDDLNTAINELEKIRNNLNK